MSLDFCRVLNVVVVDGRAKQRHDYEDKATASKTTLFSSSFKHFW